jgi:GDSL-like Lipase/Acylhydrolase family
MRIPLFKRRSDSVRQGYFKFIERRLRHERSFKIGIVLATLFAITLVVMALPWGIYLALEVKSGVRSAVRQVAGIQKSRTETNESWKRYRQLGIDETRPRLERLYAEADPPMQGLMRYAGMDPEHALLRWGNFNWTLLLSPRVFEADDTGLSYRMRPLTHSIWLRNLPVQQGVPFFFLVPDEPDLTDAIRGTKAKVLHTSRQFTNSWGLRGSEPDLEAPLRGLVLGDSYMQGMFIGDDETPPEYLRRYLRDKLQTRVAILNTGVMGYSPEQYYYSLIKFANRFRPQFVVVSIFINDIGDVQAVSTRGVGDWDEGRYWMQEIVNLCKARKWPCLIVPAPFRPNVLERRYSGNFPGRLMNILDISSLGYLNPMDDFVNEHLRVTNELMHKGIESQGCHLFLAAIGDDHFSAAGSELWAASVGKRLILLMERDRASRERPASVAQSRH